MSSNFLLAGALVGAVVAIIGWIVSHLLTVRRERDKVRRDMLTKDIDFALDLTRITLEMVLDYHTSERSKQSERKILIQFDRLGDRIVNLPLSKSTEIGREELSNLMIDFKRAATGMHFQEEHDWKLSGSSDQLAFCQHNAARLESGLLRIRHHCYEPLPFIVINQWCGANFSDQQ
ncbi:hypothetical protein SBO82_13375 [Alcaligenes nematophilus]|uniref:hypothetical protein n=1 Tax=Alcaligenes nematophilus TaxID=2994643 RepID=UPI0024629A71|nr:hypothetical protein [Alcaligenes nematophilus]MDH4867954.1 hypothetical protein [Bacillus cereus]MDY7129266.1 hypothetical protein [Alcaligenes nematophilus]